jgi:predicted nucleotidyltransferase
VYWGQKWTGSRIDERGKPIAVIKPLNASARDEAIIHRLEAEGLLRAAAKPSPLSSWSPRPLKNVSLSRTLREERDAPMKTFDLMPKDAAALEAFAQLIRDRLKENLVALKLFGSKVRGDTQDSYIDVLVVVNQGTLAVEDLVLDIAFDVNLKHDVYISPKVITQATLEDPIWKITPFFRNLAKEGIPL